MRLHYYIEKGSAFRSLSATGAVTIMFTLHIIISLLLLLPVKSIIFIICITVIYGCFYLNDCLMNAQYDCN